MPSYEDNDTSNLVVFSDLLILVGKSNPWSKSQIKHVYTDQLISYKNIRVEFVAT